MWYLKDKEGHLQPVLGWTIEELEELYQLKHGLKQREQSPRFSLQWMSVTGVAKKGYADLTVQFKIFVREGQVARIPLRLNQAVLHDAVQYKGSGQETLDFEEGGEGYVLFLRGGAGQTHELTLKVLVPLSEVGAETRLKLSAPRATSSELKLQVPVPDAVARVSDGATLLPPAGANGSGTELTVLGLGGDLELAWRKHGDPSVEVVPVLEAVGAILAKADSREIDLEARLQVRAYGGQFDRFRVRLPKGAELVSTNTTGYTLVPVPAANDTSAADAGPLVEVQLAKKVSGEVEVSLTARLSQESGSVAGWTDLAGFEVVGAVRQWGYIAVSAVGDWHVLWGPSRGVRQRDELPKWLRSDNLVAGYEYFHQPFSLTARVVPRRTRISVEPEYLLLVEAKQVRLEAKLKYAVRGAKVFALNVELPNWQLEEVGPENVVDSDGVAVDASGMLSIPLLQPSVGQIEITIRAKQAISGQQHSLLLGLPRPEASSLGPAAVVVAPADNVELTPNAESIVGLVRQQSIPEINRPQWQQTPLFYRVEGSKAVFAGDMRVRSRAIAVDVATQINLDDQKAQVEQRLAYTVSYEPVDRLTLTVPRALAGLDQIQVSLAGQLLTLGDASEQPPADPKAPVPKRVALPSARIGLCELTVRYSVPLDKVEPPAGILSTIPLVMPTEGDLTGNTLTVVSREGMRAQYREGPWRTWEGTGPQTQRPGALYLSAGERASEVVLGIHSEPRDPDGSTVVSRAWIQTWLIGDERQDRAVFRFTSNQKRLKLLMPTDVDLKDVGILVDGETASGQSTPERELLIPLKGDKILRQHRLEVWYHFRKRRVGPGAMKIELPRLGRDVWVRQMYWQLVLPKNEHLVTAPAGFTPEFRWSWNGLLWGREATLDQAELDSWAGAQRGAELPAAVNRYLFSSLGSVGECEVRTANRSLIVLTASGIALVVGLLLIYVPILRHPGVLLALAIGLMAAVTVYPGPALLAAQAAGLGVILSLLAGLLERSVARRRSSTVSEMNSSLTLERGSTQIQYRPAPVGGESTDTAQPALPASPSESHV